MPTEDGTKIIRMRTPEAEAFFKSTERAMAITPTINQLTFDDADKIRELFSELIGRKVDNNFRLIPPFYTASGLEIHIGQNVFINQNCTIYDLAEIHIGDNVMIGPNVNIISASHPVSPLERFDYVLGKPIVIKNNVWIAAGVVIIGGVTVGENSVIAAGSVVTKDVPPNTLVGGNPAKIIRSIID